MYEMLPKAHIWLFGFVLLVPAIANAEPAAQKQAVTIGVIAPLTGGLAMRGDDISKLAPLLEAHFSEQSQRYAYRFSIDDGKCGAGNAPTTIARKFIHVDKIEFLITGCSGETLQAGPIAQRHGVLTFAVLSTHQDVKKLGDYVFRTFVDIERGIERFAQHLARRSGGRVAILTEENAFTFGIRELLHRYLGDAVIFTEDYPAGTSDFNTLLAKIKAAEPGGVFFNALSETTLTIQVNQGRTQGMKQPFFAYNMPEAASFREATGANSEGLEFIGSPDIPDASAEFKAVYASYLKAYPEGPSNEFLLRTFFDAVKSIADAIEAVGPDASRAKEFLESYQAKGALGSIEYDENGDIKDINYFLRRIENGENRAVGDLTAADVSP